MSRFTSLGEFEAYVRSQWDAHGDCCSCGWHGLLYEHGGIDELPDDEDYRRGYYRLSCVSKDDEDPTLHRGVRIPLPPTPSGDQERKT